jgi:ketol-acid reductoisomerase
MLGLADGLGVLRAGAVQMTAKEEATLDLFVEQSVGAVLGVAIMMPFEVARDAGVPAEALVLEMYMSGEMEAVFQSFRESGFFRASEDHGPTAVFGGLTRSLEMDREGMAESFRKVFGDIRNGGFAKRLLVGAQRQSLTRASASSWFPRTTTVAWLRTHSTTSRGCGP